VYTVSAFTKDPFVAERLARYLRAWGILEEVIVREETDGEPSLADALNLVGDGYVDPDDYGAIGPNGN
jgi:hypothetical protein